MLPADIAHLDTNLHRKTFPHPDKVSHCRSRKEHLKLEKNLARFQANKLSQVSSKVAPAICASFRVPNLIAFLDFCLAAVQLTHPWTRPQPAGQPHLGGQEQEALDDHVHVQQALAGEVVLLGLKLTSL